MGSLNNILPEKIGGEVEDAFLKKLKSKMFSGAAMFVNAVRTIEEEFGDEGREKIHKKRELVVFRTKLPVYYIEGFD